MSNRKSPSRTEQSIISLERWLVERGLRGNPFERQNADNDEDLPNYFVDTHYFVDKTYFADIRGFNTLLHLTEPCVVFAQRGCGKTAQRKMLAAQCYPLKSDSSLLAIEYTYRGFERAIDGVDGDIARMRAIHHVSALLRFGLTALLGETSRASEMQSELASPHIASRLAPYVARFAPHLANAPAIAGSLALGDFDSLELMQGFSQLLKDVGFEVCVVLVDGLDEFHTTASDPSQTAAILASLLGTPPLITCPGWAFKFFLPQELEPILQTRNWFRPDRVHLIRISWNKSTLLELIRNRLTHYSQREPPYEGLGQLCEDRLGQIIDDALASLAEGLPRTALSLANMLLHAHCQQPDPPELIALETWERVKAAFLDRAIDSAEEEKPPETHQAEAVGPVSSQAPNGEAAHPVLRVEEGKGLVWLGECEIRSEIKPKDYSVLACLYRHESNVCSKYLITQEAWPGEESEGVSDQAIAASIARLRKVLRQFAPSRNYIATVRGKKRTEGGYRLHPEGFD